MLSAKLETAPAPLAPAPTFLGLSRVGGTRDVPRFPVSTQFFLFVYEEEIT